MATLRGLKAAPAILKLAVIDGPDVSANKPEYAQDIAPPLRVLERPSPLSYEEEYNVMEPDDEPKPGLIWSR